MCHNHQVALQAAFFLQDVVKLLLFQLSLPPKLVAMLLFALKEVR